MLQYSMHIVSRLLLLNMVYLKELSASARTDLDNYILVKLQAGRSTRDVASELQVSQSHVSRLRRKRLFDIPTSSGGRPQTLTLKRQSKPHGLGLKE